MPIQMASRAPPSTSSRLSSRHNRGIGIQVTAFLKAGATSAFDGFAHGPTLAVGAGAVTLEFGKAAIAVGLVARI
jgi:hypothetical protein